jgi:hypothetical protein
MTRTAEIRRVLVIILALNLMVATAKIARGLLTGSVRRMGFIRRWTPRRTWLPSLASPSRRDRPTRSITAAISDTRRS